MNAATRHIIFTAMLSPAMSTASNPSTAEIPYSTGNEQGVYYGVDNDNPVLAAFRAYIEPETGVGASYYEIVYDRAIVFHRRA